MQSSYKRISPSPSSGASCHPKDDSSVAIDEVNVNAEDTMLNTKKAGLVFPARTTPPFILSHDLSRGVIFAVQALLGYSLMLAIMWVPVLLMFLTIVGN